MNTRWKDNLDNFDAAAPAFLQNWMKIRTSITHEAAARGKAVQLFLINEAWENLSSALMTEYALTSNPVFLREIYMLCDGMPLWYARTFIPHSTYQLRKEAFLGLNKRPIGDILYHDPAIERGPFSFACLHAGDEEHRWAQSAKRAGDFHEMLWARRSTFLIEGQPLCLLEVFFHDTLMQLAEV